MFYEHFADSYDDMINWDFRFQAEVDHLKDIIHDNGIKTVLDIGCGTGMHTIVFSKLGLNVTGIDNNEVMLERAFENVEKYEAKNVRLKLGSMTELAKAAPEQFDAVVCLGNTLPHLTDDEEIIAALEEFYQRLKPGGLCLIQLVNFDHYLDCADSAVAVSDGTREGKDVTFRRHYEFKGTKVIFHVSIFDRKRRELLENYSTPLNAIRKDLLQTFMENVGFTEIEMVANFNRDPIDQNDRSFVIIARRPLELEEKTESEES